MAEYSFANLSPFEFEDLSRDIIQKKENIFLESFTNGKDEGIDFRRCSNSEGTLIVQAEVSKRLF